MIATSEEGPAGAQRIAQVAARLFAQHGFQGVSMARLAHEAGVSKATIFHHYTSKDALYNVVLRGACQEMSAWLQERFAQGTAEAAIRDFAHYYIQHLFEHADVARLVLRELFEGDPERIQTLVQGVYGENFTQLLELIQNGQTEVLFTREIDPAIVAVVLIGAQLFFFQATKALEHTPGVEFADQPHRYVDGLLRLILDGLRSQ